MPNDLSGEALDAKFFEVCWPGQVHVDRTGLRQLSKPPVSTDATACEAWAMRWAREQGLSWRLDQSGRRNECRAEVFGTHQGHEVAVHAYGTDWKEAFVRACEAAGQVLNQAKGGA